MLYPASACVHCDDTADPCPSHPGAPRYETEAGDPEYKRWRTDHPSSSWPRHWIGATRVIEVPPLPALVQQLERETGELVGPALQDRLRQAYSNDPERTAMQVRSVLASSGRLARPLGVLYSRLR